MLESQGRATVQNIGDVAQSLCFLGSNWKILYIFLLFECFYHIRFTLSFLRILSGKFVNTKIITAQEKLHMECLPRQLKCWQ